MHRADLVSGFLTATPELGAWHAELASTLTAAYVQVPHGDEPRWSEAIDALPDGAGEASVEAGRVVVGESPASESVMASLRALMPWRKGPWRLLGVDIDTEWRSDWKWERLAPHITPLTGRHVLDIGTGNGYFLYRMLDAGAKMAVGVDPTRLFLAQFTAIQRLAAANQAFLLPLKGEQLPPFGFFDTVFSMGVLYHRRSPADHIAELASFLRPGGELVLETLVHPEADVTLAPEDRYAQMRNVWYIPGISVLEALVRSAGMEGVRVVDINTTSTDEQRSTPWMTFHSLADFLDPDDPTKTVEGYPAPRRAIVIARKAS